MLNADINSSRVKNEAARADYEERIQQNTKRQSSGTNTAVTGERHKQLKPTVLEFDETNAPFNQQKNSRKNKGMQGSTHVNNLRATRQLKEA